MGSERKNYRIASSRQYGRRRRKQNRLGATAVEFAVVAPVFFALVLGLVEFGRMTMVKQALSDAACIGCRTASLAHHPECQRGLSQPCAKVCNHSCRRPVIRLPAGSLFNQRISVESPRSDQITVNVEVKLLRCRLDLIGLPGGFRFDRRSNDEARVNRFPSNIDWEPTDDQNI